MTSKLKGIRLMQRPWRPQDLIDDLQLLIDEEPDSYLNDRRTTLCMARDFLKEHFAEPCWISVKDALPERKDPRHQRGFYLVALSNGVVKELAYEYAHYDNMLFPVGWHDTAYPVTHWMPLPEPPEVEV